MTREPLKTYLKLCTEFYDLEQHVNGVQALSFYMEKAHLAHGPILEPMCGSGRFLIPMLQAGLDAEGFDASAYMIDAFKHKYAQISAQEAPIWQQFVQDFDRNKLYNLIFIPYGSWGLITNLEDAKTGLAALYNHLAPGGKFIVEIETIASVPKSIGIWQHGAHTKSDGSKIALTFLISYQSATQLFQSRSRYDLIIDEIVQTTEEEIFQQYLYRFDELDVLLKDIGVTNIKKYPAFDCAQEVTKKTPTIIYECVKAKN